MQYTSREVYEFISKKTSDPIVEWKICAVSGTDFPIYQSDLDFYTKISPTFIGQKFHIPTPTLCPEERQRRRLSFRNERKLYKRKCDLSNKDIISIYSPDKPHKVYDQTVWWSDARDPMDYGFEFDFSKSFTQNFNDLIADVPRISLLNGFSENTDYANHAWRQKDCYLSFAAGENEKCLYGSYLNNCFSCFDSNNLQNCSNSFKCVNCSNINQGFNLENCIDCDHCRYGNDLIGCSYCIGCVGLMHKKYHIYNKKVSSVEFELFLSNLETNKDLCIKNFNSLQKEKKNKTFNNNHTERSRGDNIKNGKSGTFIYDAFDFENIKHSTYIRGGDNIYDCDIAGSDGSSIMLEGHTTIGHNVLFGNLIRGSTNVIYCDYLLASCSDCFGCIGLRNKQYCIFNKQYENKEKYEEQVSKIIQHMMTTGERGEFFHPSLSPFGYNETVAQEYFPLSNNLVITRNEIQGSDTAIQYGRFGYKWSDYSSDPKIPVGATTLTGDQVPNDSNTVTDDILKQVIICEASGRPYIIQKAELEFYRKHKLSIPRKHPDVRHEERMKLRPGRTLYLRSCDCCGKEMLSIYPIRYQGKVYCEECYQKEVFA